MTGNGFSVIGKPLPKIDTLGKVTGATRYADDLSLPRMLFGRVLRSPHPHALIRSIDVSKAAQLEGVHAVLTGSDLPVKFGIMPTSQDEEALAISKVRYVGDPVAAVAAASEAIAERALELIAVEYEPLAPVMSIEEALRPCDEERKLHSWTRAGNVHKAVSFEFGDVDAGFRDADRVFEDTFFYQGNTHLPMEQYCALAQWDPRERLTIWSSTQTPHYLHRALAKVLEMPMSRIRVIATPVGGGFGGKTDPFSHEICAAKLSKLTGRPVKLALSREECFYVHRGRHPVKMRVRTGVKSDGRLTAMHFTTFLDGGGYSSYGLASVYYTGALQTVTYQLPAYKFEGARVFTNKPPCGPKRGHGTPQPRFAMEVQLDEIAQALAIDPVQLRLRQLIEPFSVTVNGLRIGTCGLRECIERVAARANWESKFKRMPRGRGIGFAASTYISGAGLPIYWNDMPHSGVQLRIDRGGGVTVFCGSTDIGQGSNSILAYAVAEELGLEPADVRVVTGDTDLTPVDLGSYSSRVTVMTGNAAIDACRKLKVLLLPTAAKMIGVGADELEMIGGVIRSRFDSSRSVSFADCVERAESEHGTLGSTGSYRPPPHPGQYKGAGVGPSPSYSYSAAIVELACDTETGTIKVEKVWIAHDCGRAFNPILVEGQVEGSVYMALGEALVEEQVFRKSGLHKLPSMLDYKALTALDTPEIETILIETNDPEGPFGAKEAGQGPLLPVVPALANAVHDAIGLRFHEIPITPEKVLRGLAGRLAPVAVPQFSFPPPVRWQPGEGVSVKQKS
jgi:4-hydroxybenzoyl-CoA reductase subunit alpha